LRRHSFSDHAGSDASLFFRCGGLQKHSVYILHVFCVYSARFGPPVSFWWNSVKFYPVL
jgi:hypothetical protein